MAKLLIKYDGYYSPNYVREMESKISAAGIHTFEHQVPYPIYHKLDIFRA